MKLLYGLSLNNNHVIKSEKICDLKSYPRHLSKTGHSKYTDIGPELSTPDFDKLSVPFVSCWATKSKPHQIFLLYVKLYVQNIPLYLHLVDQIASGAPPPIFSLAPDILLRAFWPV